ncbi:FtsK/SpoIIIE domain-containing protein [bacterium]|nr:FtsK/SpoIIIE domain-containing protein [bacterium]
MKDNSVSPTGLLATSRQRQLLDGLSKRFQTCSARQSDLQKLHFQQEMEQERNYAISHAATMEQCRDKRRKMLAIWDEADETQASIYEETAVRNRIELSRLTQLFKQKTVQEQLVIEQKVQSRCQAVTEQYENRKDQPGQQKRKEVKLIDEALLPLAKQIEEVNHVTIRRLDMLPEIKPDEEQLKELRESRPETIKATIESLSRLTKKCEKLAVELQSGAASKIVDSFYLPAGVAVFLVIWAIGSLLFVSNPSDKWLWAAGGIVPACVLGFGTYLVLLWPLKRMTRRIYPKVLLIGRLADEFAVNAREAAKELAETASAELVEQRDAHLAATERWKKEQTVEMQQRLAVEQDKRRVMLSDSLKKVDVEFEANAARVGAEMHAKADVVANGISTELMEADQAIQTERDRQSAKRQLELDHLIHRLNEGVARGLQRIKSADEDMEVKFPNWSALSNAARAAGEGVDYLPLGSLRVEDSLRRVLEQPDQPNSGSAESNGSATGTKVDAKEKELARLLDEIQIPPGLPVVLHRRLHCGLVIECSEAHMGKAIDLAHQVLWRLLTDAPAGRAKLTMIDPMGRGQHFTSFMALADHDPTLVGHRIWTTDAKIENRLGELADHVEDVLQSSLRDRFERIEDYNRVAGSMAEPYRAVAAVGFPEALSRESYRHLLALLESGLRCGVFTILVCDRQKPWPPETPLPKSDKILSLNIDDQGEWHLNADGLESLPFVPADSPPAGLRDELVQRVGTNAVAAANVEIPLEHVLAGCEPAAGATGRGIEIPIGSQGANRSLCVDLGKGVQQHVLIAGKTGSGKSTLLHSIIMSGAYRYRPDQLHFYLLDFKKGVEFKPYAEYGLPHARVVGIESEREFGRSVLQRLDEELQQRGEKFRAAGVQELAEYLTATGEAMPRIMLVVDEFQELFVRDDRLAGDCTMLLDRLVRQGRSFGMHVVLSSQSLAGAYSLPRATLGQMAVRIAMQCSESDAAMILADDNTAARLISRPGEAIYNDAGGLVEGNRPFQVAWLSSAEHRGMLASITDRDESYRKELPPMVVFEGNRPCRWTTTMADSVLSSEKKNILRGLLGESVEIGPPQYVQLGRDPGRNVLIIAEPDSRRSLLASSLTAMAKSDPRLEVVYFDGARADDVESVASWLEDAGIRTKKVKTRDGDTEIKQLNELIQERGCEASDAPPIMVVIDPLERFRDLRQNDSFNFSLDSASGAASGDAALQAVLRDGPAANVFIVLIAGSAETVSRWLPRASQHDLEIRILGQMNQSDSALLIDSPIASELSAATMLVYDDADGSITKFRQCDLPNVEQVKDWLAT